jgi:hypothetical protein
MSERCRKCGCGDNSACFLPTRSGHLICTWVDDDLCSACIPDIAAVVGYAPTASKWKHAQRFRDRQQAARTTSGPVPVQGCSTPAFPVPEEENER